MTMNNNLTHINEGGLHSQNPLGGVPMGGNNTVEQGETIQNNFVYSDRIILDNNLVSQFNLPKSLVGKSMAEATKFIDNKFKGRNDKISQSTKNNILSKIGEAQEFLKSQDEGSDVPQDQNQMAFGGFNQSTIGQAFDPEATGAQQTQAVGAGLGALGTAVDLGKTAFGKPAQDTSGQVASAKVDSEGMIGGSALKGATAGMAFGPIGAGVGAVVGGVAGLLGANKAKKAALENTNNFAFNQNRQMNGYAYGGIIDPIGNPTSSQTPTNSNMQQIASATGIGVDTGYDPLTFNTKKIVKYQPGVNEGRTGKPGFYIYTKEPTDPTFDHKVDREFIYNTNMKALQRTPQWQEFVKTNQFKNGGKMIPIDNTLKPVDLTPFQTETISDFKSPDIKQMTSVNPTTLQKLKLAGQDVIGALGNSMKDVDLGNLARYAPSVMNAIQLKNLKRPDGVVLNKLNNRYKPTYMDTAGQVALADQQLNNINSAISQSGASQGAIRSSLLGAQLNRNKAISNAYTSAQAHNAAQDAAAQQFNLGVDQTNLQQSNLQQDINDRNIGNYDTQKSKLLGQLGNDIGNIGKEEVYKKIAATTTGYNWLGKYIKDNPNATPTEILSAYEKENQSSTKALGGYLMKKKY